MSFIAPLFLLGAAALTLPVLFHLVRRTTRDRTLFSSLLFLSPTPPRLTRRSRIEDLLLLLLRCLALALLAFGFSRPFVRDEAAANPLSDPPERILVLLDTSASMRREGVWEAAARRVQALARDAKPADELAIWAFDRGVRTVLSFEDWQAAMAGDRLALVVNRMQSVEPTWASTHADTALMEAAEAFVEGEKEGFAGPRRLVLVSDMQDGARTERLQSFDWPKGLHVALEPVGPTTSGNAGLQWIADERTASAGTQAVVRLRVANSADSTVDRFEVGWVGSEAMSFAGRAEEVQVPPGQNRVVTLPAPRTSGGPAQILLMGDRQPFDNRITVVPPSTAPRPALYLGSDTAEDPASSAFFLQRAFPTNGALALAWRMANPALPLDAQALSSAVFLVATELPSGESAQRLANVVRQGRTLVFAPSNAAALTSLGSLLGLAPLPATDVQPSGYALLGTLDFRHPLLSPFADVRFSDFTRIHFWKYRRFDAADLPGSHVIARFDSGDPAIVEVPLDRGRVLILASGWNPADSQLALSTKFVPLLASIMERDLGDAAAPRMMLVGDPLPISPPVPASGGEMRTPSGEVVKLADGVSRFEATALPGLYELQVGEAVTRFTVNIDPAESRTVAMPAEGWEVLGTPLKASDVTGPVSPARQRHLAAVEMESRQKLWRWIIAATLVLLVVETLLAGWRNRRLATFQEATS